MDDDVIPSRFLLGQLVTTPSALKALQEAEQDPLDFLCRHALGDWGEICEHDRKENEFSLKNSLRLFSQYRTKLGEKLWVITEHDRSATTILLPEEY